MADPKHPPNSAAGDPRGAADLLPLVYAELRALAAAQLASEPAGHTLEPTALVHEAYLRLAGRPAFPGRSHFLAAAGEAMRRVLIDHARKKGAGKRGGGARRAAVDPDRLPGGALELDDLIAVDEALTRLAATDPAAARLAALRLFAGLSVEEAGDALGVSRASAYRDWTYARAWLSAALSENPAES
jgi:RNA polymerase sigma factor (TIGR02999 family)